jgi:transcriptional regulator with XRE-family HTH domain
VDHDIRGTVPAQSPRVIDPTLSARIGGRIKRAREEARLSQGDLASALQLSQAAISTIESGARPLRVDELVVVSRLTGRDIDYFLAPSRSTSGQVGVSLRAEVAALAVPEIRAAVVDFLDEVEQQPLPPPEVTVRGQDPAVTAREVLARTGQREPPVEVLEVARALGVGVFARPLDDALSALVIRHGDGAVIGVNSAHAHVRQRFSVAHELGHFVIDEDAQHFVEIDPQSAGAPPYFDWRKERRANDFAAELLMPADRVRADVKSFSMSRLAHRYDVSQAAMGFRLAYLRLRAD